MRARSLPLRVAVIVCLGAFAVPGCGDDDSEAVIDAGPGEEADAGSLERPPALPRPPTNGLPDELRPPR